MKITKIALSVFLGGFISLSSFASENSDYVYRTENNYNDLKAQEFENLNLIYSIAVVTKGATGYYNLNDFENLYTSLLKCNKEKQLTDDGVALFNFISKIRPAVKSLSKNNLTQIGTTKVGRLGADYSKSRVELIKSKESLDSKEINIQFVYDGDELSLKTGEKFVLGMTNNLSLEDIVVYDEQNDEKNLAFFYSNNYKNYLNNYPELEKAIGIMRVDKQYNAFIESIIPRVLKKQKYDELLHIGFSSDSSMSKIDDKDFVSYIYELYKFIPSLNRNLSEQETQLIDKIIRPDERKYFSKMEDRIAYYRFGPGFKDNQIAIESGKNIVKNIFFDIKNINSEEPVKVYLLDPRALISVESYLLQDNITEQYESRIDINKEDNFSVSKLAPLNSILVFDVYKNSNSEFFVNIKLNGNDVELTKELREALENNLYNVEKINEIINK